MIGFNTGYIEELYRQYLADPNSVGESWREFFEGYQPSESFQAVTQARQAQATPEPVTVPTPAPQMPPAPKPETRDRGDGAVPEAKPLPPLPEGVEKRPLRGASARVADNMEDSLEVPTATSVRTVPVKLLFENRKLINDYQKSRGGYKVSFTHLIAYALVQALKVYANMNTTFRREGSKSFHVVPEHVNLGLAIDVEKRGKRTLLVPNIKAADTLNFAQFLGYYNDLVKRARNNTLEIPDFQGTNVSLTNPGMIGTVLSVPRLMAGQGVIVGVGAIGYPPEYYAFAPDVMGKTGVSQIMTITSTYDHRVIQGAESGAFLKHIEELLRGEHDFYDLVFRDLGIPYQPYRLSLDNTPRMGGERNELDMVEKQARVLQLIRAHRVRGHLQADVNPLGHNWEYHPELDPAEYGLTVWDLDRKFVTGGLGGKNVLPLRDILDIIRETYTRKVGIEFMHIQDPQEKRWLIERIEPVRGVEPIARAAKVRMLQKLNAAEAFERFLHTKYIGHKRFSLEGGETVIPMIDMLLSDAADQGVRDVVIGMAHRGRLNLLANILNKPYEVIFSEFEGSIDPNTTQGSGDVKYHLGAHGTHTSIAGNKVNVELASNPSHLEAVNPVVEGMIRARQDLYRKHGVEATGGDYHDTAIPLLIHGDAAFAGQGVVAETLNLSQLPGYRVGGTIHVVINNQIGFTTNPDDARSSTYATDVARMVQAPIFHVNGDDPEACIRVARLALDYRQVFNKDVVIDMLCYRVHGHNEGDEPTYTQPLLYEKINAKRSPRFIYTERLVASGSMAPEEAEQHMDEFRSMLQEAKDRTDEIKEGKDAESAVARMQVRREKSESLPTVETAVTEADLQAITQALTSFPDDFNTHKKLIRQFERRPKMYEDGAIDWGYGEAFAFGTLLMDGTTVRLSGQDSRRGTFSHRHGVLYDQETGDEYIPLNHIRDEQAELLIYDSFLSEYAVCGFEYGYSVADKDALVIWEAQFGDFSNGAQIVFDQFMSAAEAKWGQSSSLVLLLPHGYEGQGPEHSSARLERFLQLCAENNMIVASFTTPANLFHALRRQVKRDVKKPLIVMSPKSLLRHPMAVSAPADFTQGTVQEIIPDTTDPAGVKRLIFCSGKVAFDAMQAADAAEKRDEVAIVRVEQLYPFPADAIRTEIERHGDADVVWLQEEPANMGAWQFLRYQFDDMLEAITGGCSKRIQYAGRHASASPASGSGGVHKLQQDALLNKALGIG